MEINSLWPYMFIESWKGLSFLMTWWGIRNIQSTQTVECLIENKNPSGYLLDMCDKRPVVIIKITLFCLALKSQNYASENYITRHKVKLIPEDKALDTPSRRAHCLPYGCGVGWCTCRRESNSRLCRSRCQRLRGKNLLFQPAFIQVSTNALFNEGLLHIHAGQTGSCPAEPEVFTAKSLSEWRLTTVCWSRALWLEFLWKGRALVLCGIQTGTGVNWC